MKTELTTEDRERIEEWIEFYLSDVEDESFKTSVRADMYLCAEYATIYEREQQANGIENYWLKRANQDQYEKISKLEAERSEVIRRIKSILKASTVHDKISILEELEQLLNSLKK